MVRSNLRLLGIALSFFASVGCGSSERAGTKSRSEGGSGGMAGAGGSGASGGAGMAGGGAGGMLGAPQWLAYITPEGNFAYDAATFPATEAVTLSAAPAGLYLTGRFPAWSWDGKYLAYFSGDALARREMTTHAPGPEVTLATGLMPVGHAGALQWSQDSKSISVLSGTSLYVVDPTSPSPTLNLVTSNNVRSLQWAPAGGGLVFGDDDGLSYVRITAGVPGTPEPIADIGQSLGWSRDGTMLAVADDLEIFLYDVSGASVERTATVPIPALSTYANPVFNSDGSLFAFNTDQGITYVATSAPATTTGVIASPVSDTITQSANFSLTGSVMVVSAVIPPVMTTNQWFSVTFTGTTPSEPTPIPGTWQYSYWVPGERTMIATDPTSGQASRIDLSGATPVVTPYPTQPDPVYSVQWAPVGDRLAFYTRGAVILASRSDPSAPTQRFTSTEGQVSWTAWSSAGTFMAIQSSTPSYDKLGIEVVRVDGASPSIVIPLVPLDSTSDMSFAWQPVTQ